MIRIELTETEHRTLLEYLEEYADDIIKQQHFIKDSCLDDMEANDRNNLQRLTTRLKWLNKFINAISKGKKI